MRSNACEMGQHTDCGGNGDMFGCTCECHEPDDVACENCDLNPATGCGLCDECQADGCYCHNGHEQNDTVCVWCYQHGRRKWNDPDVASVS